MKQDREGFQAKLRRAQATGEEVTDGVGLFHVDEMGGWLAALDSSYNRGGKQIVTEWLDYKKPDWTKITKGGTYLIHRPFVSILAASTTDWLSANASEADVKGGFFPRWLFLVSRGPDYKLAIPDPADEQVVKEAHERFARLLKARGELTLSPEAENAYWEWHQTFEAQDARLEAWGKRLVIYALKLAMLYQADSGGQEIAADNMGRAMRLIDRIKNDLALLLQMDLAFNEDDRMKQQVVRVLREKGRCLRHVLSKFAHLDKRKLDAVLDTLIDAEEVVVEKEVGRNGHPATYYTWKG